jgi:hypothetical protein
MTDPDGFLDENGNLLPWQDEVDDEEDDDENIAPVVDRIQPAVLPVSLYSLLICIGHRLMGHKATTPATS